MSLNRARGEQPAAEVAASAVLIGQAHLGAGSLLAQGVVLRSRAGRVALGNHSAVLENGVLVGWPGQPVEIGQRTVFGHRATIVGARVGDLCEIGNGAILMPGSRLGNGCILGEGTLIPAGTVIPDDTVLVGRPPHVLRTATDADRARLAALRGGQVDRTSHPGSTINTPPVAGVHMGRLYAYRDKTPRIAETAVLFDSAEITGDVVVGAGSIIGAGVKIIGDSHGPVRIGARGADPGERRAAPPARQRTRRRGRRHHRPRRNDPRLPSRGRHRRRARRDRLRLQPGRRRIDRPRGSVREAARPIRRPGRARRIPGRPGRDACGRPAPSGLGIRPR
jgi:carbonic anhydrase/acetyltransferase-like protein (isoleucine patch superfamily)